MGVRTLNGNYGSRKVVSLGHNFADSQENVAAICPWARPRRKGPFAIIWGAGCRMQTTQRERDREGEREREGVKGEGERGRKEERDVEQMTCVRSRIDLFPSIVVRVRARSYPRYSLRPFLSFSIRSTIQKCASPNAL